MLYELIQDCIGIQGGLSGYSGGREEWWWLPVDKLVKPHLSQVSFGPGSDHRVKHP